MSLLPHLIIDLNALCYNYRLCKNFAKTAQTAAVVKNNAYGLGAPKIAQTLYEKENCRTFFVAYASEGAEIRRYVPNAAVYLLNGFCPQDADLIKEFNLIPVLSSTEQIKQWNKSDINIRPALQVETGLHRLGVSLDEIKQMTDDERGNFSLILSHLASADDPLSNQNKIQYEKLNQMRPLFPKALFSLAASDGIGLDEKYHFDVVRAGAFMYGLPVCEKLKSNQQSVINAYAKILQIKDLAAGDSVGYNATFVAQKSCKVAAISIGYGDGFFRSLSGKGRLFFKEENKFYTAPIIGRVSMDITMCDVSDVPAAALTSQKAYLFSDTYNLNEMGKDAGTIGYEVLSALNRGQRWIREFTE